MLRLLFALLCIVNCYCDRVSELLAARTATLSRFLSPTHCHLLCNSHFLLTLFSTSSNNTQGD